MRSLERPVLPIEVLAVGGVEIDIGILGVVASSRPEPKIVQRTLAIEVTLVCGAVVHIGLDDMKLAQVPAAGTVGTDTHLRVMMVEVGIEQRGPGLSEILVVDHTDTPLERVSTTAGGPLMELFGVGLGLLILLISELGCGTVGGGIHLLLLVVEHGVGKGALPLLEEGALGGSELPGRTAEVALVGVHVGGLAEGIVVGALVEVRAGAVAS